LRTPTGSCIAGHRQRKRRSWYGQLWNSPAAGGDESVRGLGR